MDPEKIRAIQEMSPPATIKERTTKKASWASCLISIRHFIPNLTEKTYPLILLLKKDAKFAWNHKYQLIFDAVKQELIKSPTLTAPIPGKPLALYLSARDTSIGVLLA